jgi:hypothetical protein
MYAIVAALSGMLMWAHNVQPTVETFVGIPLFYLSIIFVNLIINCPVMSGREAGRTFRSVNVMAAFKHVHIFALLLQTFE